MRVCACVCVCVFASACAKLCACVLNQLLVEEKKNYNRQNTPNNTPPTLRTSKTTPEDGKHPAIYTTPAPAPAAATASLPLLSPFLLHHLRHRTPYCYPRLPPHTPRPPRHCHDGSVNHLPRLSGEGPPELRRGTGQRENGPQGSAECAHPRGLADMHTPTSMLPAAGCTATVLPQQPETRDLRIPDGPQVRASVG